MYYDFSNPNLLLDQCKNSKGVLRSLTENQYEVIKKFLVCLNKHLLLNLKCNQFV